ncbi:hypothetical protein vseg_008994 [Gypsophila vaccaria]
MGLSSKQVSSDGSDWNQGLLEGTNNTLEFLKTPSIEPRRQQQQQQQQQQPPPEQLKCPRCDSTNTKFCYYNNYNKSQPRHFCKACKRHWTKGGTLRNVPVGGGRKNKRLKMSKPASKTTTTTTTTTTSPLMSGTIRVISPTLVGPFSSCDLVEDKNTISKAFYQNFVKQQQEISSIQFNNNKGLLLNDGNFLNSTTTTTTNLLSLGNYEQEIQLPYTSLGCFESNPCSISSTITPILYNFTTSGGEVANNEDNSLLNDHHHYQPTTTTTTTTTTRDDNNNDGVMEMSSNWGWDDFDKFVSVDEGDLTIPWDDSYIKP